MRTIHAPKGRSQLRYRRHLRVRQKVAGTAERPRLVVFRSLKHIYAQLVDDDRGVTLMGVGDTTEGVQVEGICIYPVTAYPGWDNSRHCEVGLLSTIGSDGKRDVYEPLYEELRRQREIFGIEESSVGSNSGGLRLAGGNSR